jgi:hypothetical protein
MATTINTFSEEVMREIVTMLRWWRARDKTGDHSTTYTLPQAPDDYVAYTGSGGIAARSGTTITGELCTIYVETGDITSGSMTLSKCTNGDGSDYQLMVYNLSNVAVNGSRYVVTSRLKSGVRYVVLESCNAES